MHTVMYIVNVLVKMGVVFFWASVGYIYLLGLVNTVIKNYFREKEASFKRSLQDGVDTNVATEYMKQAVRNLQ
jgi:hypothetical protein